MYPNNNKSTLHELYNELERLLELQGDLKADSDLYNEVMYQIQNTVSEIELLENEMA